MQSRFDTRPAGGGWRRLAPALGAVIALLVSVSAPAQAPLDDSRTVVSGSVRAEFRGFLREPRDPVQHGNNLSLVLEPELYYEWEGGRKSIGFTPFVRLDQRDPERTHADLRELMYEQVGDTWEIRLGVGKVFWGVAESQHLVDVINQTDLVENVDGEDKLGQPMANLALIRDWGTVDLFVLPGFRERTFPGRRGRLRSRPRVDADRATYESSRRRWRVDYAARFSRSIGDWDVGLSHFYGTSREPRFSLGFDGGGNPVLIPRYDIVNQTGLDLQVTKGSWLWKFEGIRRSGQGEAFIATTAGFEYTVVGAFGTRSDLGLLAEYLFDDRGDRAPTPFEDDLFFGVRLALNDAPSTELLAGVIWDRAGDSRVFALEASRRFGDAWKLYLESRVWSGVAATDPGVSLRDDDYVQLELARFF